MSTNNDFFVINETIGIDAKSIRISGDLILKGDPERKVVADLVEGQTPDRSKLPQRAVWVLSPQSSTYYSRLKKMAEEMGYRTVEHGHPARTQVVSEGGHGRDLP
jgi:hypothetical protein